MRYEEMSVVTQMLNFGMYVLKNFLTYSDQDMIKDKSLCIGMEIRHRHRLPQSQSFPWL